MKESFVARFCHIPLVSAAVDHVGSFYSRSKQHHPVVGAMCRAAEISCMVAAISAQPILDRLEQPIDRLNDMACCQLDKLQSSYPIINAPTELLIRKVQKSVIGVFSGFSPYRIFQNEDEVGDKLTKKDADACESSQSVVLTWHLSPGHTMAWLLPKPMVLLTVAEKLVLTLENLFYCSERNPDALFKTVCNFYCRTVKFICCQLEEADRLIHDQNLLGVISNSVSYQSLQELFVVLLTWFVYHSPLVFLMPDFNLDDLPASILEEDDDDGIWGQEGARAIGFVPLNPADLAALPAFRPQRMYWRRRH